MQALLETIFITARSPTRRPTMDLTSISLRSRIYNLDPDLPLNSWESSRIFYCYTVYGISLINENPDYAGLCRSSAPSPLGFGLNRKILFNTATLTVNCTLRLILRDALTRGNAPYSPPMMGIQSILLQELPSLVENS